MPLEAYKILAQFGFPAIVCGAMGWFIWWVSCELKKSVDKLSEAITLLIASSTANTELTKERLESLKSHSEKNDNWLHGVIKELIQAVTALINENGKQSTKLDLVINQNKTFINETRESRIKASAAYDDMRIDMASITKKVNDMPDKFEEIKNKLEGNVR